MFKAFVILYDELAPLSNNNNNNNNNQYSPPSVDKFQISSQQHISDNLNQVSFQNPTWVK